MIYRLYSTYLRAKGQKKCQVELTPGKTEQIRFSA